MTKSVSVVINARVGSSRVKNKLLRPFSDRCLLDIALEKLDHMDFFDKRFLAVADEEMFSAADKYKNVEILKRDPASVKPGVNPVEVTFKHYLDVPSDYVFVFNPCLPCISVKTIKRAFDYFQVNDFNSYTAAFKTGDWIFDSEGNSLTCTDPKNVTTNKNVTFLKGAHAFHIINVNYFRVHNILWTFGQNDPHPVEIDASECVDVDTPLEFDLAELYYTKVDPKKLLKY